MTKPLSLRIMHYPGATQDLYHKQTATPDNFSLEFHNGRWFTVSDHSTRAAAEAAIRAFSRKIGQQVIYG